jgi:hypothetical protein
LAIEWFEVTEGRELRQGDVLLGCPVFVPDIPYPFKSGDDCNVNQYDYDLIILSQSCDLVEGQKLDVRHALLCQLQLLDNLKNTTGHKLAKGENRKRLAEFGLTGYHPIPECIIPRLPRPYSVIQFSPTFTLPVDFIRQHAQACGARLRLRSPYRELLAQRFGYYFGRIAIDEPPELPG